jgi:hypothetical protein
MLFPPATFHHPCGVSLPEYGMKANQSHLDDPEHWRERAKEVRSLADQVSYLPTKQEILRIAADYERLAERAEERAKRQS